MTTYNTGNPVGSTDVRDLYDNAQNLDNLVNGPLTSYADRLGDPRKSWRGIEQDFSSFLAASGFELPALEYVDGTPLVIDRPTQLIFRTGFPDTLYGVKSTEPFPATLSGTWATDESRLVVRSDGDLRQDLASSTDPAKGAGLVGYKPPYPGSHARTQAEVNTDVVTTRDFGAAGDGVTDDTAAIQAAIDYCVSGGPHAQTKKLIVVGKSLISSSLMIDRPIDQSKSEFIIEGSGEGCLTTNANGLRFFSSRIPETVYPLYGTMPSSEWVTFRGINFHSPSHDQYCYAVDGVRLLRVKFDSCYFSRMGAAESSSYLQTFNMTMCQARQWGSYLMIARGLFDVHVDQCQFEHTLGVFGGSGFYSYGYEIVGSSFTNNLYEGCQGSFITSAGFSGVEISGNYLEANKGVFLDGTAVNVNATVGVTKGLSISGNYIASHLENIDIPEFFEIVIGECHGLTSSGNSCTGRLYDFRVPGAKAQIGSGDYAAIRLARGSYQNHPTFPLVQIPSAEPNVLDDYAEGSFQPFLGENGNYFVESGSPRTAKHVKIGKSVHLSMGLDWTSKGTARDAFYFTISGLPFDFDAAPYAVAFPVDITPSTGTWFLVAEAGTNTMHLKRAGAAGLALVSDLPSSGAISAQFSYISKT